MNSVRETVVIFICLLKIFEPCGVFYSILSILSFKEYVFQYIVFVK